MIDMLIETVKGLGLIALIVFLAFVIVVIMQTLIQTITKGGRKNVITSTALSCLSVTVASPLTSKTRRRT